ncbi:hypothetical protein C8J56DRAFT_903468 [Mycena floridula]|nr:hypothetical protein C8J56DRAFT_903468 [Mycena floridula]
MSTDPTTPLTPVQGHTDLVSNAWLTSYNLAINQVHHLWICLDCNIAVLTSSIAKHTTKSKAHPGGTAPTAQFIDMLATQNNMAMVYPDTTHAIDAIDGLQVTAVRRCSGCRTFFGRHKTVSNHIKTDHQNQNPEPQPEGTYNGQQFNKVNKAYFQVNINNLPPPPAPGGFRALLQTLRNFDISNLVDKTETDARLVQPWLKINGFHLHVADHDTADLRQLVALPSVRKDLPRLGATVIAYFKKAEATLKSIDHIILCKLNTRDIAKTAVNNTPLHGLEQEASLQAYCRTITHLVAGLLRAHSTPGYKFPTNPTLDTAIGALHTSLQDAAQTCFNELHAVFLSLFSTLWTAKDDPEEGHISDPTMCFLALFALKADGEFLHPINVTGPIRHLTWSIEFAMAVEINARVKAKTAASSSDAYNQLSEFVQEKISNSTFQQLNTLQHYTSSVSFSSMRMPDIWWQNQDDPTCMLFQGKPVTLDMYKDICSGLIKELVTMWDEKILLGLKNLYADHSTAIDNLRSTKPKYSFIHDPENDLASIGKDFLTAIFESPELRDRFTEMEGSERVLKKSECLKWLQQLAKFEGRLMLLIHFTAGGPARGTEITNLLAENTATRTRNFFLFGRHVTILRHYSKDNNISQQDRYIPMGLCGVSGDLLVQLHSLARPLAVLFSAALEHEDSITLQYKRMLFMGFEKPFTSKKLATLLRQYTSPVTSFDIAIADFRQIFVGFRERNLGKTHNLLLEDGDSTDTIEAEQMGHSRTTEKANYGLCSNGWEGASDEIILLFLQASSRWQVLLEVVPGALQLPYHSAAKPNQFKRLVDKKLIKLNKPTKASATSISVDTTQLQSQIQQMREDFNAQQSETNKLLKALLEQNTQSTMQLNHRIDQLSQRPESKPIPAAGLLSSRPEDDDQDAIPAAGLFSSRPEDDDQDAILPARLFSSRPEDDDEDAIPPARLFSSRPEDDDEDAIPPAGLFSSRPEDDDEDAIPPAGLFSSRPEDDDEDAIPPARLFSSRPEDISSQDILIKLRELLKDPNADWTCAEQREAVEALLNLERDVIVAMRTASGKSLVFILAAILQTRVCSVLFIPLRALLEDWKRRLDNFGIPYHHFHASDGVPELTGEHNIILVSSDVGRFRNWEKAIDTLNARKPVGRIGFDESQLYIGDSKFRNFTFAHPDALRRSACQVVLLSGSAPPDMIPDIVKTFGLVDPIQIRTRSARLETIYHVGPFIRDVKEGHEKIMELVNRMRSGKEPGITWGLKDRYLVYVQTLHDGYELAELADLDFYHGTKSGEHEMTEKRQKEIWDDWVNGYKIGLICTSALQAGIDYASIRLVVHLKQPRSMNDYIQESARATRDGKLGIALLLPTKVFPSLAAWSEEHQRLHGTAYMKALTNPQGYFPDSCVRYQMGIYNDGSFLQCPDYEGAMLCSGCIERFECQRDYITREGLENEIMIPIEPVQFKPILLPPALGRSQLKRKLDDAFGKAADSSAAKRRELDGARHRRMEPYMQMLEFAGKKCGCCLLDKGVFSKIDHKAYDCPAFKYHRTELLDLQRQYRYSRDAAVCWKCHVPSFGGNTGHDLFIKSISYADALYDGEDTCEQSNLLLGLAFGIWRNPRLRQEVADWSGCRVWTTLEKYRDWLVEKQDEHKTNWFSLVVWLAAYRNM